MYGQHSSEIPVTERPLQLPKRKERGILRGATSRATRLIAIGDVHGRWDLLAALIRAIDVRMTQSPSEPTKLIILGDFIDRGPDSRKVVELLQRANRKYKAFIVLKGNHEASLVAAAHGDADAQNLWLEHGGSATLESFGIAPKEPDEDRFSFAARIRNGIGVELLEWIMDLPTFLHEPPYFFCHAGIRPGRPLQRQLEEDMLWIRDEFMKSTRDHGAIIVHGHNIVPDVEICRNRISLDTGAYRTGYLSAALLGPHQSSILRAGCGPDESDAHLRTAV